MPSLAASYKGPAVVVGVGGSMALVGMVPVAATLGLGIKSSATIIGVGFMGFGFLLIIPGICWCLVLQRKTYLRWRQRKRHRKEHTPALGGSLQQSYGGTKAGSKQSLDQEYMGQDEKQPLQKHYDDVNHHDEYETKDYETKDYESPDVESR